MFINNCHSTCLDEFYKFSDKSVLVNCAHEDQTAPILEV